MCDLAVVLCSSIVVLCCVAGYLLNFPTIHIHTYVIATTIRTYIHNYNCMNISFLMKCVTYVPALTVGAMPIIQKAFPFVIAVLPGLHP